MQSISLLYRALQQNPSQAHWTTALSVPRNALSMATRKGKLSPAIAGNLAQLIDAEHIAEWIAVAALEGEKDTYSRRKAREALKALRNF